MKSKCIGESVDLDVIAVRKPGLIEAEVGGELVGLHVDNGTCYGFNATATRVWALLSEPKTLGELRDSLAGEFDVDLQDCASQVAELLMELEKDGLVELKPS
jgi:hypothetical protein